MVAIVQTVDAQKNLIVGVYPKKDADAVQNTVSVVQIAIAVIIVSAASIVHVDKDIDCQRGGCIW